VSTAGPAGPPRRRMSARAEKAVRLAGAGALAAPVGLTGVWTGNEVLGYVAAGIVLAAILAGPVVERIRGDDG